MINITNCPLEEARLSHSVGLIGPCMVNTFETQGTGIFFLLYRGFSYKEVFFPYSEINLIWKLFSYIQVYLHSRFDSRHISYTSVVSWLNFAYYYKREKCKFWFEPTISILSVFSPFICKYRPEIQHVLV